VTDAEVPAVDGPEELVLASSNAGKLAELRVILESLAGAGAQSLRVRSLAEFPPVELPEEGDDYLANAIAKARAAATTFGLTALADDSGLEVAGLDRAPGPHSARFGGPGLSDRERADLLLVRMTGLRGDARRASFVCNAALAWPDGGIRSARGECRGVILEKPSGSGGFGYDPVFQPDGYGVSMAELPAELKNRISHRARALRALWWAARRRPGSARRA